MNVIVFNQLDNQQYWAAKLPKHRPSQLHCRTDLWSTQFGEECFTIMGGPIDNLEPLAEVERALLVVEVLHLPHPQLGGLGLSDSLEHL